MPGRIHALMKDPNDHDPACIIGSKIEHVRADREFAIAAADINRASLALSLHQITAGVANAGDIVFGLMSSDVRIWPGGDMKSWPTFSLLQ